MAPTTIRVLCAQCRGSGELVVEVAASRSAGYSTQMVVGCRFCKGTGRIGVTSKWKSEERPK